MLDDDDDGDDGGRGCVGCNEGVTQVSWWRCNQVGSV